MLCLQYGNTLNFIAQLSFSGLLTKKFYKKFVEEQRKQQEQQGVSEERNKL